MSISAYDHDHVYLSSVPNRPGAAPTQQQQRVVTQRPAGAQQMSYANGGYGVVYQQPMSAQHGQQPQYHAQPSHQNAQPASNSLDLVGLGLLREPTPEPEPEPEPKPEVELPPSTSQPEDEDDGGDIDIQIRNVVCNYSLPLHIDLRRFALESANVTYDRGRGVLLKQKRDPHCYVKIYSSGKVYIVGCKSEDQCRTAARSVARQVQRAMGKLHEVVHMRNYKVCNVLATCRMPFGIKIEDLAQKYPAQSQYEPELSVGLVWRMTDPKGTLRIHTTGSITVTGASSEESVIRAIEIIYPIVREFRCSERHRAEKKKKSRKRAAPASRAGPSSKRGAAQESGAIGNKIYFSDEDDIYDEDDLDDDDA